MTSTINASNSGGGGIIQTADASGVLNLQGGGNTGISISATGVPTLTTGGILNTPASGNLANCSGFPTNTNVMSYLVGNVTMTTGGTWYNGPNTGSIGAAGQVWMVVGSGLITWPTGAVYGELSIHDGTNYLAFSGTVGAASGWPAIGIPWWIGTLSGPTTFTLRAVANQSSCTLQGTTIVYGNNKCTYISAVRLA